MEPAAVSSLAVNRDQAKVSVLGVPSQPGLASHILGTIARVHIEADVVVQNAGKDGKTDLSFTVCRNDSARTVELLKVQLLPVLHAREVVADTRVCKISIACTGTHSPVGTASKLFGVLREEGIQAQMVSTTETCTSVLIDETQLAQALRTLHRAFGLDPEHAQAAGTASEMRHNSGIGNVTEWPKVLPC